MTAPYQTALECGTCESASDCVTTQTLELGEPRGWLQTPTPAPRFSRSPRPCHRILPAGLSFLKSTELGLGSRRER